MSQLDTLICGAGIAGSTLAYWLAQAGHKITLIERAPEIRNSGLGVDVRGPAVEVIRRMGILEQVRARTTGEEGIAFVDSKDHTFAFFGIDENSLETNPTSEIEIMRSELAKLITTAVMDDKNVEIRYATFVTAITQDEQKAFVTFNGGKIASFDLVIAADGLGSSTRKVILEEDKDQGAVRSLGQYTAYFSLPREERDGKLWKWHTAPGSRILTTRPKNDTESCAYLSIMPKDEAQFQNILKGGAAEQKGELTKRFDGAGWQTSRLLSAMQEADDFYLQHIAQVKLRSWHNGRLALVGDAAYGPSPLSGVGTSLAILGAYVLAGEIVKSWNNPVAAFQAYEEKLRSYVEKKQKIPPGVPRLVQSGGSFDIDYSVLGPSDNVIMGNNKERQVDAVFTAKETGEYRFCFDNEMSTYTEKMVDFEIAVFNWQVEGEGPSALLPAKQTTSPEQTSGLEESILKVSRDLSTINRNQKYFRTRENRNFSTVKSTETRIFNFSVVESGLMVCMAGLQVFIVRFFFQGARKDAHPDATTGGTSDGLGLLCHQLSSLAVKAGSVPRASKRKFAEDFNASKPRIKRVRCGSRVTLPEDIFYIIAKYCDQGTRFQLSQVSTNFLVVVIPSLYRHVDLSMHAADSAFLSPSVDHQVVPESLIRKQKSFLRTVLKLPNVASWVRSLCWTYLPLVDDEEPKGDGFARWRQDYNRVWRPLINTWEILAQLPHLRHLNLGQLPNSNKALCIMTPQGQLACKPQLISLHVNGALEPFISGSIRCSFRTDVLTSLTYSNVSLHLRSLEYLRGHIIDTHGEAPIYDYVWIHRRPALQREIMRMLDAGEARQRDRSILWYPSLKHLTVRVAGLRYSEETSWLYLLAMGMNHTIVNNLVAANSRTLETFVYEQGPLRKPAFGRKVNIYRVMDYEFTLRLGPQLLQVQWPCLKRLELRGVGCGHRVGGLILVQDQKPKPLCRSWQGNIREVIGKKAEMLVTTESRVFDYIDIPDASFLERR
ncbi:uncharacterized protein KY384_005250 [Bacidia gigantensis]|uniref:uncharacterized protein n=1 Tax=Bacidia gigantensis TaxID=2732470 RepID=UPI001D03B927|nr:uncharacterized protein KY384_005250 [Bacidia gigantensis]KAG8529769.1 hypothetical protein KY384_005250 [Bacidia gigantensis]